MLDGTILKEKDGVIVREPIDDPEKLELLERFKKFARESFS